MFPRGFARHETLVLSILVILGIFSSVSHVTAGELGFLVSPFHLFSVH